MYIFDLDGTLADNNHRQHLLEGDHQDWDSFFEACDKDKPIMPVIDCARSLFYGGHRIYILSGRSAKVQQKTEKWLDDHKVPFNKLVMRPEENYIPDEELKWKMVKDHIGNPNRIQAVFDDRQKVVDMWRENGIKCFQVENNDF